MSSLSDLIRNEFPLQNSLLYFNHAAVAPWPQRAVQAVCHFAQESGAQGAKDYPRWMQVEQRLRTQIKTLIQAPKIDDISLVKNTSEALSIIAYGMDWRVGDKVVFLAQEFPSNRIVWESLRSLGVIPVKVVVAAGQSPENALIAACDHNTRLISLRTVQYASGYRMDVARIAQFAHTHNIHWGLDAIQSLGALPMDVQALDVDFVAADGHKWMLGPEGLAVLYVREAFRQQIKPRQFGWHMVQQSGQFDQQDWTAATDGKKYEPGSPNSVSVHGLEASLSLINELEMEFVTSRILANTQHMIDEVQRTENLELVSSEDPRNRSGICCFRPRSHSISNLFSHLTPQQLVCALRGNAIRFSPHFYNDSSQIAAAFSLVRDFCK